MCERVIIYPDEDPQQKAEFKATEKTNYVWKYAKVVEIPEEVQKYLKENGHTLNLNISTGIKNKWHRANNPDYKLRNLTTRKVPNWAFTAYDNLETAGLLDQYLVTEDNPLDFTVDFSLVDALDAMCTIKPEVIELITSVDPVYAELRRIRNLNI